MNRRTLLTNAAATFGGAALIATSGGHASATTVAQKSTAVSYRGRSIILTRDGTELFYRDWGTDAPVIFLAGWALSSDFWAYQMGRCRTQVSDVSHTIVAGTGDQATRDVASITTASQTILRTF